MRKRVSGVFAPETKTISRFEGQRNAGMKGGLYARRQARARYREIVHWKNLSENTAFRHIAYGLVIENMSILMHMLLSNRQPHLVG